MRWKEQNISNRPVSCLHKMMKTDTGQCKLSFNLNSSSFDSSSVSASAISGPQLHRTSHGVHYYYIVKKTVFVILVQRKLHNIKARNKFHVHGDSNPLRESLKNCQPIVIPSSQNAIASLSTTNNNYYLGSNKTSSLSIKPQATTNFGLSVMHQSNILF